MEQLLRMLMMLSGTRSFSLDEIAERFQKSERTIYRQLNTLENAGFVLERTEDPAGMRYKLAVNTQTNKDLRKLIHFTEDEASLIYKLLSELDGSTQLKDQLLRKLHGLYDVKAIHQFQKSFEIERIQKLDVAIQSKKQIILKNYRSSHSSTTLDRRVEPVQFLEDYKAIWCLDIKDLQIKTFKVSRIEDVEILQQDWEYSAKHVLPFVDIFRMSAPSPIAMIKARLTLKAYNLLLEDHPAAKEYVTAEPVNQFYLKVPVADFNGIGRFVLGLPGEVKIIEPQEFVDFVEEKGNLLYR